MSLCHLGRHPSWDWPQASRGCHHLCLVTCRISAQWSWGWQVYQMRYPCLVLCLPSRTHVAGTPVVAHHSVRLARVMVLDVERITNMSCDAGVSLTQASYVHETVRIHAHRLDHTGQVSLMEGFCTMSRPPTQITCCKTCTMPPPGNAVGRHQSDVHLSPSVEADKTSAVSPSGREPHRTIMKMSTPRPRATPDHQEDVHTQAKSHTGLSRRRPHTGEEPHFTSPAEADTGHGPHRSGDDQKTDLALLVSFPCCCGCFSFGVLCCPCFVAVLWRPRSRLCCVLAFCGSTLFFEGANPRTGLPSSFQVFPPSLLYAVGMQYGRGIFIYWVLLALMLFSRFTLDVQPTFLWSAVLSYLLRHPSPRSHFWDFRQQGADMDGLVAELLQVTQSCVARRNLSFIIERETTLLRCTSQAPHEPGRVALPREPSAESVSSDGNRPSSGENGCRHYAGANLDTTLCAVLAAAYLNTGRSHFGLQTHHGSESTRSPQFLCGRTRLLTNSVSSKGRTSTSLAERR